MSNKWLDEDDGWQEDDVEEFDPDKDYFTQKIQKKENNMLESTERSLRILEEAENVGASTAVELHRQGEVLRHAEQHVDKIQQDLKQSDRHLRSIKSLWGAFMNKFSKEPEPTKEVPKEETVSKTIRSDNCQPLQNEKPVSGYSYDQANVINQNSSSGVNYGSSSSKLSAVDNNLDLMGNSLSRLKNLGLDLQQELDAQDPIIDRLHTKVGNIDEKMHKTNKEMLKIYHS